MNRPRSRTRTLLVAAATLTAVVSLAGCSSGGVAGAENPQADAAQVGSDANIAEAQSVYDSYTGPITDWGTASEIANMPDLEGGTVWYVPMVEGIPTMATIGQGLEQALEEVGASMKVCDGQGMPTAVASCLRQAKSQGADAVVTAYVDYNAASTAFEELVDAGVPVLIGGVAPADEREPGDNLAYFEQEIYNGEIFEIGANATLVPNGADTNILWVRGMDTPTTQKASDLGIAEFERLCPSCDIKIVDGSTPQLDKLASEISAALVSAPGVNTVFVPIDAYVPTVASGIASGAAGKEIAIISTGADLAGLQRIESAQQTVDLGVPPIFTGWSFAHALMQLLAGEEVEMQSGAVVRIFDEENTQELTLDATTYATNDWYGEPGYVDMFLTAWGK